MREIQKAAFVGHYYVAGPPQLSIRLLAGAFLREGGNPD
jgi:hypothetical protein